VSVGCDNIYLRAVEAFFGSLIQMVIAVVRIPQEKGSVEVIIESRWDTM